MTEAVADKTEGRVALNEDQVAGVLSALEVIRARSEQFQAAQAQAEQIMAGPGQALQAARARYQSLVASVLKVNGEPPPADTDYVFGVEPAEDGSPGAVFWRLKEDEDGKSD